ncbi:MAG: hypothetical protein J6S29_03325 [Methanosphaera sp.]|nr:hypothetical protein [Methanosphaera sp.]
MFKRNILLILVVFLAGLSVVSAVGPEITFNVPHGFYSTGSNTTYMELMNDEDEVYLSIIDSDQMPTNQIIKNMELMGYPKTSQRNVKINKTNVKEYVLTGEDGTHGYVYAFNFGKHNYTINAATSMEKDTYWNVKDSDNPVNQIISSLELVK